MEKVIYFGGNYSYKLVCNAFLPILYKRQFGNDFFAELSKITEDTLDTEVIYKCVWCMAKLGDKSVLPFDDWLEGLPCFPFAEIVEAVNELVTQTFKITKKD